MLYIILIKFKKKHDYSSYNKNNNNQHIVNISFFFVYVNIILNFLNYLLQNYFINNFIKNIMYLYKKNNN